ncbi:AAA family ATPase [Enterococcus raffinosus]|uniref:AAA family ATPase n=1 Tax=Enterococcus raffinosus TaxID=71452 RepID=A0AAW8TDI4_9ENTE|nr:AAA family ATPase [Enterococcus raffinosus]MDT2524837.1 AAA family ATPase [Enterococcus raffinosus]MDT2530847.1 AAA family ATPase [Enterococcus raffinosus]MDT2535496.1 AAA family ATPase [Enterococcus raffinosus]MDT2545876.1 AAA family ATPase [Enterococcus raffinosus]MDT2556425.1 AAA family ATPase [Enterococcus raffinosus]
MFVHELKLSEIGNRLEYPFGVFAIQEILRRGGLLFEKPVTFLSGDNGTGKSTILEAIAVAYGINPEGGSQNFNFNTVESHSELYQYIRLVRKGNLPKTKFFLRSETYYNVASELEYMAADDGEVAFASYGGKSLHTRSHGEGLLSIIENRFGREGFYLLDEPEAGLATSRQYTLLQEIHRLVKASSQLIIATHSPILLGYPEATIYQFSEAGLESLPLEETIAFKETKLFYDDPNRMLYYLLN